MLNLGNGELIQLDDRNRSYFKTNTETLNQYLSIYRSNREMIQGLIDQSLRQLEPEKRAQVEQMVNQLQQPLETSTLKIKPTDQTDQVLGVECRVISLFDQDRHTRDICVSDYQQMKLTAADRQSLERLRQFIQHFRDSAPGQQQDLIERGDLTAIKAPEARKRFGQEMAIVIVTNAQIERISAQGLVWRW